MPDPASGLPEFTEVVALLDSVPDPPEGGVVRMEVNTFADGSVTYRAIMWDTAEPQGGFIADTA